MKNLSLPLHASTNPLTRMDLISGALLNTGVTLQKIGNQVTESLKRSIMCLLFVVAGFTYGYSQGNVFDGNYLPVANAAGDEYADAFTQIVDPGASSTCEIEQIWAKIIKNVLNEPVAFQLGFKIGNAGTALFRIYVDTDNNSATGLTTDPDLNIPVAGAEYIFQINSNSGETILFTGSGSTLTPAPSAGIAGLNGNFSETDKKFIEVNIPFGSIGYNPCNPSGSINFAQYASVKGGSVTSSVCGSGILSFEVGVGGEVTPDREVCSGSNSGLLTLNGYVGTIVRWEYSTDGGTVWTPIANTNETYTSGALTQTTQFRAVVTVPGCPNVQLLSNHATITVGPGPSVISTPPAPAICSGTATSIALVERYPRRGIRLDCCTNRGDRSNCRQRFHYRSNTHSYGNYTGYRDLYDYCFCRRLHRNSRTGNRYGLPDLKRNNTWIIYYMFRIINSNRPDQQCYRGNFLMDCNRTDRSDRCNSIKRLYNSSNTDNHRKLTGNC